MQSTNSEYGSPYVTVTVTFNHTWAKKSDNQTNLILKLVFFKATSLISSTRQSKRDTDMVKLDIHVTITTNSAQASLTSYCARIHPGCRSPSHKCCLNWQKRGKGSAESPPSAGPASLRFHPQSFPRTQNPRWSVSAAQPLLEASSRWSPALPYLGHADRLQALYEKREDLECYIENSNNFKLNN